MVISYSADAPCPGPFTSSALYVTFVICLNPDFSFLSKYVMLSILISIFVRAAAGLIFA